MHVYLVDGHAIIYRSYFAFIRRPLVNSKGEETSAVYGFANTLMSLLEKFDPHYIAVTFDSAEKTFRHEVFEEYKANRPDMPEGLVAQLPRIFSLVEAMSIPSFILAGYEADDIIATIARKLADEVPVRIVSGDKDLLQLLSDRIHVIRPGKGGVLEEEIDPRKLEETMGFGPGSFADYLALMGDPSDNVPGVSGVGEKTARKLISRFGTLENLYANIDEVTPESLKKKLIAGEENAFLSRDLIRLDCNVPIEVSLEDLRRRSFDRERLERLFEDLEFTRMLRALRPESPRWEEKSYRLVDSEEALRELAEELRRRREFAVDVEASDLNAMRATLAGIAVATEPARAFYVPVRSTIGESEPLLTPPEEAPGLDRDLVGELLGPILADEGIGKIGQNIKYDAIVLSNAGMPLEGVVFDTMVASYCLHPARRSHGLDSLAEELLGHKMIPFEELFDKRTRKKDIRLVDLEKVKEYACEDADMTLRLKEVFESLLETSQVKELFHDVEMPLCRVLTDMELWGVRLDTGLLDRLSREIEGKLAEIERSIHDLAGKSFNVNSTRELREVLFGRLKLKPKRKTKTGYSTDVDVLKALSKEHELPGLVLEYRMLSKLKSTYVDALPKLVNPVTGRVHTSYNQAVTSTGRLSSSDPNLQNIPIRTPLGKRIREAFVAGEDGWLLFDADYSQIELRILAHLSKDVELVKAFRDDADVHRRTAAMLNGVSPDEVTEEMRSVAKTVNFGIIYGMGPRGLSQALEIDFSEAKKFIDEYFEIYPGVKRFVESAIEKARRDKAATTLLGRVRQIPEIDSTDGRSRSFAERVAVNTPVQGTAADIIKVAMVRIWKEIKKRGLEAKMILQVHDELLFDAPERERDELSSMVRAVMENAIELDVPLRVDSGWGRNWLEAHD